MKSPETTVVRSFKSGAYIDNFRVTGEGRLCRRRYGAAVDERGRAGKACDDDAEQMGRTAAVIGKAGRIAGFAQQRQRGFVNRIACHRVTSCK